MVIKYKNGYGEFQVEKHLHTGNIEKFNGIRAVNNKPRIDGKITGKIDKSIVDPPRNSALQKLKEGNSENPRNVLEKEDILELLKKIRIKVRADKYEDILPPCRVELIIEELNIDANPNQKIIYHKDTNSGAYHLNDFKFSGNIIIQKIVS
jgi:hypothetical protein